MAKFSEGRVKAAEHTSASEVGTFAGRHCWCCLALRSASRQASISVRWCELMGLDMKASMPASLQGGPVQWH